MIFEFDPDKSAANLVKHGIDFEEAQELWKDGRAFIALVVSEPEQRFLITGMIGGTYWTAIVTYRGESVRLISVRRSRKKEVKTYDSQKHISR